MSEIELKLNVIGEPILLAADIMNCPAFWKSLSAVQRTAVIEANAAQLIGQRTTDAFADDADLAVWGKVQRRYQVEVVEPSEKTRQEMQKLEDAYTIPGAKLFIPESSTSGTNGISLADWLNSKSTDPFAAPATVVEKPETFQCSLCHFTYPTERDREACFAQHRTAIETNIDDVDESAKPLWPRLGVPEADCETDMYDVQFADGVQVVIDRTQQDEIQLRVWKIGEDNPLATHDVELPERSDCVNCGDRVGFAELSTRKLCTACTSPYKSWDIDLLFNFANGYASAIVRNAKVIDDVNGDVDEWVRVPGGSQELDIHFLTNDDEASGSFGMLQAWGYRRPLVDGDTKCESELRLI